jgi:hypothetical protein
MHIARLCRLALLAAIAAPAAAQEDYSLYVILPVNAEVREKYGASLENVVAYDEMPFNRTGMRILNASTVGNYPFAGIHMVESDANYMERHIQRMRTDLHRWVDPDYDGIVIIDYETWWAAWDHTQNVPSAGGPGDRDKDFQDDWEDYLERYHPELLTGKTGSARQPILRETYEEATVRFLVETLRECKRLCPNAKWGYFNYPKGFYGSMFTGPGAWGYGDLSHYASRINDRLAPLWAEIDVTCPRIFPPRQTVPEPVDRNRDNDPATQYIFIASHVHEAKRVAPHALCVPLGSTFYFGAKHKDLFDITIGERNTWMQFAVPRDAGADGVGLWGDAMNDETAIRLARYMNEVAGPIAGELWEQWYPGQTATSLPAPGTGAIAQTQPTAGGAGATPAPIPTQVRMRQSSSGEVLWSPVRQGAGRVSLPGHSAGAASVGPVYRGARVVGRRALAIGDSPPVHRPALTAETEEAGGEAAGTEPEEDEAPPEGEQG